MTAIATEIWVKHQKTFYKNPVWRFGGLLVTVKDEQFRFSLNSIFTTPPEIIPFLRVQGFVVDTVKAEYGGWIFNPTEWPTPHKCEAMTCVRPFGVVHYKV